VSASKHELAQTVSAKAVGPLQLNSTAIGKDDPIGSGIFLMGSSFTHRLSPPFRSSPLRLFDLEACGQDMNSCALLMASRLHELTNVR
jgi:hypothetical protein